MKRIRHLRNVGVALVAIAAGATFAAQEAAAQTLVYSAKFVCGTNTSDQGVVIGLYETSVNIHNPHFREVRFQKKAVIALPQRSQQRGPISKRRLERLKSDEAVGVDCVDIRALFGTTAPTGFIEGFVVLYVPRSFPLDVVGVNTARERKGSSADTPIYDVSSISVERVTPINVQGVPQQGDE